MIFQPSSLKPLRAVLGMALVLLLVLPPSAPGAPLPEPPAAVPAELHEQLCRSIAERRQLTFTYDGHLRVVEPHAYGLTAKDNVVLRAYQTGGSGSSGDSLGWHLFAVAKIEGLTVGEASFAGPRPDYRRGDRRMARILAEL
jgi:hypothetical protein